MTPSSVRKVLTISFLTSCVLSVGSCLPQQSHMAVCPGHEDTVQAMWRPLPRGPGRDPGSAPRERRVADRVQLAGLVPGEPERFEQRLPFAEQFPGDQRPDADHLVAVVGVGYHVGVL